ncbi:MAG: TIGR01777 family protein [Ktedonobacterales bacterium]|nr:TIGR01777 family protein [Ktedonobacterales bacterium]
MRVIITGGTGLIGSALGAMLLRQGHSVVILSRTAPPPPTRHASEAPLLARVGWDGRTSAGWGTLITRDTAIVNLAGASPAHWRWTPAYRQRILTSRLSAGRAVTEACARYGPPLRVIQASASGYYGDRGDEMLTEASAAGQGFRALVCQQWEAATAAVTVSCCVIRTGIVLANQAGAFPLLWRFAHLAGHHLGSGAQWVPWVHIADVATAISFLLTQTEIVGPVNLCAPAPTRNRPFIQALQRLGGPPGIVPLPTFALRLALGEMASAVLDSERMLPQRLLAAGFTFQYPDLPAALLALQEAAHSANRS